MTNNPKSTQTENTKELDKLFEIDLSKYEHASLKHEIICYKLY